MDSYLCTNIPIQMISCTDTDGKITPIRFRFIDRDGTLVTVNIEKIISNDQKTNKTGSTFECSATFYGCEKRFLLYYSNFSGRWMISRIGNDE